MRRTISTYTPHLLLFVTTLLLLSNVCAVNASLPGGETVHQLTWLANCSLPAAGCVLLALLLQRMNKAGWKSLLLFPSFSCCVSWSLLLLGGVQAVWGLLQLYNFIPSGHPAYGATGSFFNPGPYGGYLAMTLPLCLHHYLQARKQPNARLGKIAQTVAAIVGLLILSVLPATLSRSAWIAALTGCLWVLFCHRDKAYWTAWRHRHRKLFAWGVTGAMALLLTGGILLFQLKPDSALGRIFMWRMACSAIVTNPAGGDSFAAAYGEAQERYFAQGDYAAWEERVAGTPEYPFNEYLGVLMTHGVFMGILLLLLLCLAWRQGIQRKRYGICGALLSLGIFAFASYPLYFPAFVVAALGLLLACGAGDVIGKPLLLLLPLLLWTTGLAGCWQREEAASKQWADVRVLYTMQAYESAAREYASLYPTLTHNGRFLFEYGHSLHKTGQWEPSNDILQEAMRWSCDAMSLNIIGKNYQAMREYALAEKYYLRAVHRLPSRIYPWYLLAKLYAEPAFHHPQREEEARRMVLEKEPKVYSTAVREMREEMSAR